MNNDNRKIIFWIIGAVLVLLFFGLLFWVQTSEGDASIMANKYQIEIFNCPPTAKDNNELVVELNAILKSTSLSGENQNQFLTPVLKVDKLEFGIPIYGMNYLRYSMDSSMYLYEDRAGDEEVFFNSTNDRYEEVKTRLLKPSGKKYDDVEFDYNNNVDEFIIYLGQKEESDKNKKIWKSLASLKKHIDGNIKSGRIVKNSKIKIYYLCGEPGKTKKNSSIDSDGDGVTDDIDGCPKEKGLKELKGCPDDDGDKVPNNVDQCLTEKGDPKCSGCPCKIVRCPSGDKDLDGVCDDKDNCPNDFGQIQFGGCPPDSDGDGIWDRFDKCPFEKGLKKFQGCPDKDGDNVPDYQDKCPNVKGGVNCNGCICSEEEPTKPIITIGLSGSKFQINGVSIGGEYTATLTAKGKKSKEYTFTSNKCPSNSVESHSLANQIESDDLTVTIVVFKNGKEIKRDTFFNMSYVCFKGTDCGFKKL
jgi:hypothetical protein